MKVNLISNKGKAMRVSRRDAKILVALGRASYAPAPEPEPVATRVVIRVEAPDQNCTIGELIKNFVGENVSEEVAEHPVAAAASEISDEAKVATEPHVPGEVETSLATDKPKRQHKRRDVVAE